MKTLFDPSTDVGTRFRVKQLKPTARSHWGATNPSRVMRHLVESFSVPMGASPATAPPRPGLLGHPAFRRIYLLCVPCPDRKRLVAPEDEPIDAAAFAASVESWYDACSRFVARGRSGSFAPHPVFGAISPEEWGRLVYFHTDHHLRQFGL